MAQALNWGRLFASLPLHLAEVSVVYHHGYGSFSSKGTLGRER